MANLSERHLRFWRVAFETYFNNNPLFDTPGNKEGLWNEFLALAELDKTLLENLTNLFMKTHDATNVVAFYCLQKRLNIPNRTITIVFRHVSGLGENAKYFVNKIGSNVLGIEKASKALGSASAALACIFTAIQMYVHYCKGEYGLMFGELAKTILSLVCAPAAVFDMIEQMIGSFAPEFFNNPFTRCLRLFNGLSGAKHLVDTFLTLGMVFGYAYENRATQVEKALGDLASRWEQSPFGMATYLSRGVAQILNDILPNYKSRLPYNLDIWVENSRNFIRDLGEYSKANYVAY